VLRHSFIHLPRVGKITERRIWDAGISTWQEFLDSSALPARVEKRRSDLCKILETSHTRFEEGDAAFFGSLMPSGERWRLYSDFRHKAAFVDIETTGLSPTSSHITMIGVFDAEGYTAFVYDENLEDFRNALEKYDLILTFNGASFDIPYIEHYFGSIFKHIVHIDLRFALRRIGYSGGLKSIERQLQVGRPSELGVLEGFDAVLLWHMWREGDKAARDTLIRYNAEDVASLPALAEIAYNALVERLPVQCQPLSPLPLYEMDLPYDIDVIRRLKRGRHSFRRYF